MGSFLSCICRSRDRGNRVRARTERPLSRGDKGRARTRLVGHTRTPSKTIRHLGGEGRRRRRAGGRRGVRSGRPERTHRGDTLLPPRGRPPFVLASLAPLPLSKPDSLPPRCLLCRHPVHGGRRVRTIEAEATQIKKFGPSGALSSLFFFLNSRGRHGRLPPTESLPAGAGGHFFRSV